MYLEFWVLPIPALAGQRLLRGLIRCLLLDSKQVRSARLVMRVVVSASKFGRGVNGPSETRLCVND